VLFGLVEEGKVADMVYEDVSKDWELGIFWGNFSALRLEWGTEAMQGSRGGQL